MPVRHIYDRQAYVFQDNHTHLKLTQGDGQHCAEWLSLASSMTATSKQRPTVAGRRVEAGPEPQDAPLG